MQHVAILLAGGAGTRMGDSVTDKILVEIGGRPLFAYVLRAYEASATQDALIVVARDDSQRRQLAEISRRERIQIPLLFTLGGRERQHSVKAGLGLLPSGTEWVQIHDCARGAISPKAIQAVHKAVRSLQCAVSLAHRVTDTIRQFNEDPLGVARRGERLPRERLWAMETPQAFPRALIEEAHARLKGRITDDLAAVESMGQPVALVESPLPNPKLTRPADLTYLETLILGQHMNPPTTPSFRVGHGYDIHRLQKGLPLVLGGVRIPSERGLVGHSDADVLSHAIADAILGACGLPDIGHFFPNTDPAIKGISSQEILVRAAREAAALGYGVANIDATLIAEAPKIAPYRDRMKKQLAQTLEISTDCIGLKATTQEQLGSLGQGLGIAAHAVAALRLIEANR